MSVSISGAGSISGLDQGFNVTSGLVGIGTDDPSWGVSTGLIVGDGASAKGITLFSNSANVGDLAFADATSGTARYRGLIRYDHSDDSLALRTNSSERLRVTSTGNIGIGTDTPYANNSFNSLSIGGSGKYGLIELNKSDGVAGSWIDVYGTSGNGDLRITTAGTSGAITFWTGGSFTERLRIDSDGRLLIGHTAQRGLGQLEIEGTSFENSGLTLVRNVNSTGGTALNICKTRGSKGSTTSVQDDDVLGGINFRGADGANLRDACDIRGEVDGSPSQGTDMPGRLVFRTCADGSSSPTERLRIDSLGRVTVGSSTYIGGAALAVMGTSITPNTYGCFAIGRVGANVTANTTITNIRLNGGTLGTGRGAEINAAADANWSDTSSHPTRLTFHTVASGSTSATERLRIASNGNIGINESSPDTTLHISKSAAQNDTHGILKVESTNTGTGAQTNAGIIAKNRYGWSQFMQWEENGLRIGSRSTTTGGDGKVIVTYGSDSTGAVINENGVVTMPQQCGFHMVMHTNQAPNSNDMVTQWDTDASDSRSYIKNCTFNAGRFQAPVAGLYYFTAQLLLMNVGSNDDNIHLAWTKGSSNNTFAYWNTRHDGASANGSYGYGGYLPVIGSTTVFLTANEIFGMRITYSGDIDVYGTDKNWGHWSGFLVG